MNDLEVIGEGIVLFLEGKVGGSIDITLGDGTTYHLRLQQTETEKSINISIL